VSGQVPCSGAPRQNKVLDEVSTAILGGAAAENEKFTRREPNKAAAKGTFNSKVAMKEAARGSRTSVQRLVI